MDNRKITFREFAKPFEGADCSMTVSLEMEKWFREMFDIEIELLQGKRTVMPDGRVHIAFTVNDEQKAMLLREFTLKLISSSDKASLS